MAVPPRLTALVLLLIALAFANVKLSTSTQTVKAKVSCLDCKANYDLSRIKILVKCDKVKKLSTATTKNDGSFEAELPTDISKSGPKALNCLAKLLGGPKQLYASKKLMATQIINTHDSNSLTIATPLAFYKSCPSNTNQVSCKVASSKTIDIPLPPEWGLAPSSYYIPFFPIIGIP